MGNFQNFNSLIIPDESQNGIWKYWNYLPNIASKQRLSLGEGNTPIVKFGEDSFFKREDLNPTGSLKDRGMALVISKAVSEGHKNFVLSSSGNAAISALEYCKLAGVNLFIYVSPKINKGKLEALRKKGAKIIITERPLSESQKFTVENNFFSLRLSRIEFACLGYKTISFELMKQLGEINDIFIPVSSGVCCLGIFDGFQELEILPRIHVCQGTSVSPIASVFDKEGNNEEASIASALVAKTSPLAGQVKDLIEKSKGFGWVINNQRIEMAQKKLKEIGIDTSNEGALALAAVYKAKEKGWNLGKTVCLLTGKNYGN